MKKRAPAKFKKVARRADFYRRFIIGHGLIIIILAGALVWFPPRARSADGRLANYYLKTPISDSEARALSRFDILILHLLAQDNSRSQIHLMRRLHPGIIILAYLPSEEVNSELYNTLGAGSGVMGKLYAGITPEMWLKDGAGNHVTFWRDNWMLNVSDYSATGERWNEYLAEFAAQEVIGSGVWDGIFYDNVWTGISWINGADIDINGDGQSDAQAAIDKQWKSGMEKLFSRTRALSDRPVYLMGNGDGGYADYLNGLLLEDTGQGLNQWGARLRAYDEAVQSGQSPNMSVLHFGGGQADYQRLRFGLSSALLSDGFYAYDAGVISHAENWWYDEYGIDLGEAQGAAVSVGNLTRFGADVWRRDYGRGLVVINSGAGSQRVELGADYEKIIGQQDPAVNNGAIVSNLTLKSADGLIMLKTAQVAEDIPFGNGQFLRFFDERGQRARNGYFSFLDGYSGGVKIYRGDLNLAAGNELITVSGVKFELYNDSGGRWAYFYPLGGSYDGALNLAVGKLYGDMNSSQIAVSGESGGPVVLMNYYGKILADDFYPFGRNYRGESNVCLGGLDQSEIWGELAVTGADARVLIFDRDLKQKKVLYPFGKNFKQKMKIACGDFNGDGVSELAVGYLNGAQATVRIVNYQGKQLSEFKTALPFGARQFNLAGADVNFDGKDEAVVMSE